MASKSIVWRFFQVSDEDPTKVVCNICEQSISRGGKEGKNFNTTNMKKHLQSRHSKELIDEEEIIEAERLARKRKIDNKDDQKSGEQSNKQVTLKEAYELKKVWTIDSSQARIIHNAIGEMIAVDCQPYSIVEDLGFTRLMKLVKPNYNLPSRKYFSDTVIPAIYTSVLASVKGAVDAAKSIAFTTDIWTNNTNNSFISFTAHCIDENFQENTVVLRALPFPGSHTAERISEIIEEMLQDFSIPCNKVHVFVRDNGANIAKGIKDAGFHGLSCFLHTLQLVIHDCIFEQRIVKDIISQCKQITGHFNHSSSAYVKLSELQKKYDLPQHRLIQDVITRWNSTYLMLERIFEQKAAIANYCLDVPNLPVFDANKWNMIGKVTALLKIFHKTTLRLSERSSKASDIIPQIKFIQHFIAKAPTDSRFSGLGSTFNALKLSTGRRFEKYLTDENLILATFLDPRYKNTLFQQNNYDDSSSTTLDNIKDALIRSYNQQKEVEESHTPDDSTTASFSESESGDLTTPKVDDFDFDKCFDQLLSDSTGLEASTSQSYSSPKGHKTAAVTGLLGSEIEIFLTMPMHQRNGDPLEWWRWNKEMFPTLSLLAAKYLSCPPSSVESERLFSIGGNIYTPHRNRLKPETGEKLMFLNYNLRISNFEYNKQ